MVQCVHVVYILFRKLNATVNQLWAIAHFQSLVHGRARVHSDCALTGNIPMKTEDIVVQTEFTITESSYSSYLYWHLNTVKMMRLSCY